MYSLLAPHWQCQVTLVSLLVHWGREIPQVYPNWTYPNIAR